MKSVENEINENNYPLKSLIESMIDFRGFVCKGCHPQDLSYRHLEICNGVIKDLCGCHPQGLFNGTIKLHHLIKESETKGLRKLRKGYYTVSEFLWAIQKMMQFTYSELYYVLKDVK